MSVWQLTFLLKVAPKRQVVLGGHDASFFVFVSFDMMFWMFRVWVKRFFQKHTKIKHEPLQCLLLLASLLLVYVICFRSSSNAFVLLPFMHLLILSCLGMFQCLLPLLHLLIVLFLPPRITLLWAERLFPSNKVPQQVMLTHSRWRGCLGGNVSSHNDCGWGHPYRANGNCHGGSCHYTREEQGCHNSKEKSLIPRCWGGHWAKLG